MFFAACTSTESGSDAGYDGFDTEAILSRAKKHLSSAPVTVTTFKATRSKGGKHDYYSEGRYWWPDPEHPDGPYIRKDGQSNPELFTAHRSAIKDFEDIVCDLTIATIIEGDKRYSEHILSHLNAWFVDSATYMNPSLLYAQAIKGIVDGRGIGMIDVIGLINVSNSIRVLEEKKFIDSEDLRGVKNWFGQFAEWATTHSHGMDEKNNNNNHSTWWGAQIASYGLVANDPDVMQVAIEQFKSQLQIQMDSIGRFPHELERTKPSHYTNYTLYAWTSYAELLSATSFDAWSYKTDKGGIAKAVEFGYQFFKDPEKWNYQTELEPTFNPAHSEFLFLAGIGLNRPEYMDVWKNDNPHKGSTESHLLIWKLLEE